MANLNWGRFLLKPVHTKPLDECPCAEDTSPARSQARTSLRLSLLPHKYFRDLCRIQSQKSLNENMHHWTLISQLKIYFCHGSCLRAQLLSPHEKQIDNLDEVLLMTTTCIHEREVFCERHEVSTAYLRVQTTLSKGHAPRCNLVAITTGGSPSPPAHARV